MNPVHWTCRSADLFFKRYLLTAPDAGVRYLHPPLQDHVLLATNDERFVEPPLHHITSSPLDFECFSSKNMDSSVNDDTRYAGSNPQRAISPLRRARDWVESCPSCTGSLSRNRAMQNATRRPEVATTEWTRRRYETAGDVVHSLGDV